MKITLDYPPSANRYWRHNQGRIHRSEEADQYIADVGTLCNTAGITPMTGEVCMILHFYRPRKSGDLDNSLKVLIDALRGYAYLDDKQIVEIHATRAEDKAAPRVEVTVQPA